MDISWTESKNIRNKHKHGVSFETAIYVFDDPLQLSRQDRHEAGEERWQTLGMVGNVVLLVAHTIIEVQPTDSVQLRIISARKATRQERKHYEKSH